MNKYTQVPVQSGITRFEKAPVGESERSGVITSPFLATSFNAGDIVPLKIFEVLPSEALSIDIDFVLRQMTLRTPTMGKMDIDIYAFFVPNRVVNTGFKSVQGENVSGSWIAPDVSLAPLALPSTGSKTVPVGSVADYYGFPTQKAIPNAVLTGMHDLYFRGYLEIYNQYFRDQNYQPPIPYSKLNVYEGFFDVPASGTPTNVSLSGQDDSMRNTRVAASKDGDNSFGAGAVKTALYGEGNPVQISDFSASGRKCTWSALGKPLKANKKHDYFTSCLPSPLKGPDVVLSFGDSAPVKIDTSTSAHSFPSGKSLILKSTNFNSAQPNNLSVISPNGTVSVAVPDTPLTVGNSWQINSSNLVASADLTSASGLSISDLRFSAAIQQVYEQLARAGSRYREFCSSFFGIEADDPYKDIPSLLGHVSRTLDLYQSAQTSASAEGSTPQGNLAGFGYTNSDGKLFHQTFLEHGYVHILAVVRHRNIYSSFLPRDLFRMNMMDYYLPQLANISEQPVYTKQINPFYSDPKQVFGYQEAWAEYRQDPDSVTGYMRPGVSESLAIWNYADDFDSALAICDGDWLKSNSEEVLNRTIAVTSDLSHQFKIACTFNIHKELPMSTYSIPGLDIV